MELAKHFKEHEALGFPTEDTVKLTSDTAYYIETTGSDETGDGTIENPFATIKHALSLIPKDLGGFIVDIYSSDGEYYLSAETDVVEVYGYNNGRINFSGGGDTILNSSADCYSAFDIQYCSAQISLDNIVFRLADDNIIGMYLGGNSGHINITSVGFCDTGGVGTKGAIINNCNSVYIDAYNYDTNLVEVGFEISGSVVYNFDTIDVGDTVIENNGFVNQSINTGFLVTPEAAPGTDYEVANKKYVDDNIGGAVEGTDILSTGEAGGTKFLREDGDGTCSWQTVPTGSQTPWTSNINADGYTLFGNDGAGETLTLGSTSHATKGKILFGTSAYDEVNNRLGLGTTTPNQQLELTKSIRIVDTTASDGGVIYKGTVAFLHNFKHPTGSTAIPTGYNIFLGGAGNFTMGSGATSVNEASYNTGIGYQSLYANTLGLHNSAIGYWAMRLNTTGQSNVAVGNYALGENSTGTHNVAIGYNALKLNTTGRFNFGLGTNALATQTTATDNTAIGYFAMGISTGSNCIAIGREALKNTTASYNFAIGTEALKANTSGTDNMAIGTQALLKNTTGGYNVGLGAGALRENTTASYNIGIGYYSYRYNQTGEKNIGIGYNSGYYFTAGENIFIGHSSGYGASTASTGTKNIGLGVESGYSLTSGGSNIFIGYASGYRQTTNSNLLIIDNQLRADIATEATNAILYGVMASTPASQSLRVNAKTGISIDPTAYLTLPAGTATANTAPLKFTSGVLNTTPEAGALEFVTDNLTFVITTGTSRKGIVLDDGARLTSGKIPVATTNGRLVDLTAQAHEADAKTDYTTGDLDTEDEIITALNATNSKINALLVKLENLKLLATS